MERRRFGRLGHDSSVLAYGAAALAEVDQDTADRSIQEALDAGINHFDVAHNYGGAEDRLGPWMPRIRDQIFLATKTQQRDREAAWAEINRSLERLQTDHLDLIQLHAIGDKDELDKATGKGGALEAAIRARDEGLARFIGITGHGHHAPATHLEGLARFPFDSVLTPWNYALSQRPDFAADYAALVAEVQRSDVGLRTIKAISHRNWLNPADTQYTTWYEPLDRQREVTAAVAWVLSFPEITAIATVGDVTLLHLVIKAELERASLTRADAEQILDEVATYSSPFDNMPI